MKEHETLNSDGVQVGSSWYTSPHYCTPERFAAYAYQINEVIRSKAKSVLEIGPGNGVVTHMLRLAGIDVVTVDHDPALQPNVVASIPELPFSPASFDMVLCCQVLEHLPWERFDEAIADMARISRTRIVLSLPHVSRFYYLDCKLPLVGVRRVSVDFPLSLPIEFDGEHYWEIGKGVRVGDVLAVFRKHKLLVEKSYRPREHRYHHFFVLTQERPG